ncbi:metallophosphoesterase [Clostridium sp. DJ247]|uniref:metallophosphoesterase n=1 Tax=Clostridium sp. DJ247 TaxID=2726188 RepID=UPI001629D409|nr:metallophosphoesterase [Clostridium sp. DJ247]MBC2582440.1 metallophosphoesterase [Clostridium sp. DJ247]
MKKLFIYFAVLIVGAFFLYYQNNSIGVTNIDLELEKLPQGFDGLKIVHLSDLHSKMFGKNQHKLVSKVRKVEPEIIFITGDIVDSKHYEEQPALKLIDEIIGIAPIYYVTGNHEFWSGRFSSLEKKLQERGVRILRDTKVNLERNGNKVEIIGVDDPVEKTNQQYDDEEKFLVGELQKALEGSEQQNFKILLAHRPELLSIYAKYNIDLIFSGHAHGGQVRLPFIGGVIAPNQGLMPKYTSGKYNEGNSIMIVSRGLGNSIIPQRLFNRPEIVVVKLAKR